MTPPPTGPPGSEPRSGTGPGAGGAPEDPPPGPAPGAGLRADPAAWTGRLARALRAEGVPCTPASTAAALEALERLDRGDALDVYFGLRTVLLDDVAHRASFDRCFWAAWRGGPSGPPREARETPRSDRGRDPHRERGDRDVTGSLVERLRADARGAGGRLPADEDRGEGTGVLARALYSPHEALGRREPGVPGDRELREIERAFDRLRARLATRRGRRTRPARRGGRLDLRRSFRDALRHEGELLRLARRRRRPDPPRVVLLCDVSGSMERWAPFLLGLLLSAARARNVEAFAFGTRLTRLTRRLRPTSSGRVPRRLADAVPDWSGGTRIGDALASFVERHGRALLGRRTVVVVVSDGLERGDVEELARSMRTIRRRARRVVWMNPLAAGSDYEPTARGMAAALPWIDDLVPGHGVEALRHLPDRIGR